VDDGLSFVVEMNQAMWDRFVADLRDVTPDEADWRPLPQANSINVILRHLRIEAEWHLASLEHGAAMPSHMSLTSAADQLRAYGLRSELEGAGQPPRSLSRSPAPDAPSDAAAADPTCVRHPCERHAAPASLPWFPPGNASGHAPGPDSDPP